jgi:hypothetical protein
MTNIPKELWERIEDQIRSNLQFTCPLYDVGDRQKARLCGSANLIRIDGQSFLVTAAHVTDHNESSTVYFWGEDNLEALEGMSIRTAIPEEDERRDDKIDIAFMEVNPSRFHNAFSFLPASEISPNIDALSGLFVATGYPYTKNKPHHVLNKATRNAFSFTSAAVDDKKYNELGIDPVSHIAISFDKKRVKDKESKVGKSPNLHGISGGSIWRLDYSVRNNEFSTSLAGIVTEEDEEEKAIFGTRISLVIEAIRNEKRGFSEDIESPKDVDINIQKRD